MAVNPLPPQAYTKETLQKAYSWLLTQNSNIKEMASTQDMLISLYLKAQRNGDASLEAPNIQNFKQELKSLAHLMGDLQTQNTFPAQNTFPVQNSNASINPRTFDQSPENSLVKPVEKTHETREVKTQQISQTSITTTTHATSLIHQLDDTSMNAVEDVKHILNLSSDIEAIRALIAIGYKHFKKI